MSEHKLSHDSHFFLCTWTRPTSVVVVLVVFLPSYLRFKIVVSGNGKGDTPYTRSLSDAQNDDYERIHLSSLNPIMGGSHLCPSFLFPFIDEREERDGSKDGFRFEIPSKKGIRWIHLEASLTCYLHINRGATSILL